MVQPNRTTPPLHSKTRRHMITHADKKCLNFPLSPVHKPTWMPDFLTKIAGNTCTPKKPSLLTPTRNISTHQTVLPPVRTPAHLLPKIQTLKRSLKRSVEDAQGLVQDSLFRRTTQQRRLWTTGNETKQHSTTTTTASPPPTSTTSPSRRFIRTSRQDDQEYGLSSLSLRTKIREAQRYSKLRKANSGKSWQKMSEKKNQQHKQQQQEQEKEEESTYFRPINLADDDDNDGEVELEGESELFFDAVSAAFDAATVVHTPPRPRSISLTGVPVSVSPTEVLAANDGHVVAQIRILRAKVKSKEATT